MKRLIMPSGHAVSRKTSSQRALSLDAATVVIGPLVCVTVTLLQHPSGQRGNAHAVVFREYAMSQTRVAIHLVQLATSKFEVLRQGAEAVERTKRRTDEQRDKVWV
jgi:hypothetical protein